MKRILLTITLLCSCCFLPKPALADIDLIQLPDTEHTPSGGTGFLSIDGNWDTSQSEHSEGEYDSSATVISQHNFSTPHTITLIKFRIFAGGWVYGDSEQLADIHWYVQYYDGSWHTVPGSQYDNSCGGNCEVTSDSGTVQIPINLNNITAVLAWAYGHTHSNGDSRTNISHASIYEIQAWGPPPVVVPSVSTLDANNITSFQATLNGAITDTGGENIVERGFDWGTSPGSYSNFWTESGSFGAGAFGYPIAGLNRQTTYYFRAKARNSAGWNYGSEKSFTTDCTVGFYDLQIFCEQWLQTAPDLEANLDGEGAVDFIDYAILADYWLGTCPPDWPLK